ncbi:hypothetical protein CHS0354_023722 [Potamilus streckersoni]|uniref:4-hydroxy-3-methylbut-2-enyl diphosphate reductase n=1 Tax=Potamilus streckersoni TaxID=2493646 RepID=A0AAE0RYQ3_9BIVA|nr:hypothetical protein CHS0354_023722 [Potamilus streckersoni]
MPEGFIFNNDDGYVRLPIWGHIPLNRNIKKVLSHPSFFRLKGIRQLSFSHYVYPGATHTRFEHSIGVYHLTKLILQRLVTNPLCLNLQTNEFNFSDPNAKLILLASLLHDIGHFPHAHLLENTVFTNNSGKIFNHHQLQTKVRLNQPSPLGERMVDVLENDFATDPVQVTEMIEGTKYHAFANVISGTLDPDKMDYLISDAHHCNVPYGAIDIWRLIESFVPDPERKRLAITEKGIAPLESLMFAKYMMMKNVYWHHTVRCFSALLKRTIHDAIQSGTNIELITDCFYNTSDEQCLWKFLTILNTQKQTKQVQQAVTLIHAIIERTTYKKGFEIPIASCQSNALNFISHSIENKKVVELRIIEFLEKKYNESIEDTELIIDPPMNSNLYDIEDFNNLQLYSYQKSNPTQTGRFSPFNEVADSEFKSDFILKFATSTKKLQFADLKNETVLIRAHGEPPSTYKLAYKNNITLIDASCPVVLKLQRRVNDFFRHGYQIIIYGKPNHPEVIGLNGQCNNQAIILSDIDDIKNASIDFTKKNGPYLTNN